MNNVEVSSVVTKVFLGIGLLAVLPSAKAQSSVTLYGLVSTGILYASNQGGKQDVGMSSGPEQQPRLGFKGSEDLGGGNSAIFVLENGFVSTTGALGQGGRMFGRQAWLGFDNNNLGRIAFGRQYEEMTQQLYWSESGVQFAAVGTHIGDNDNIFDTFRFNNSVRIASPDLHGLKLAAQYAFSNSTTGFSNNNGFSLGANYVNGPLQLGIAFTQINDPAASTNKSGAVDDSSFGYTSPFTKSMQSAGVARQRIFGTAAGYDFSYIKASFVYTNVAFNYFDSTGLRLQNAEITITHRISPAVLVGIGYIYTWGRYSIGSRPNYQQVNFGSVYSLSKRTDFFLVGIYQRAGGSAETAQIYTLSPSNSRSQMAVVGGIRLRF